MSPMKMVCIKELQIILAFQVFLRNYGNVLLQLARQSKDQSGKVEVIFSASMNRRLSSSGHITGYQIKEDLLFAVNSKDSEILEIWFIPEEEKDYENKSSVSKITDDSQVVVPSPDLQEVALTLCSSDLRARAMIGDAEYFAEIRNISDNPFIIRFSINGRIIII
jgi:hypothetical protein